MDSSFYLSMHFWYLLMLVYIDLSLFKNENHILRGLVNSWLTIKTKTVSRGEKGFCCHLQSEPTASDPPDLGNGSVLKAASGMVKETVSFSHRLRSPIAEKKWHLNQAGFLSSKLYQLHLVQLVQMRESCVIATHIYQGLVDRGYPRSTAAALSDFSPIS